MVVSFFWRIKVKRYNLDFDTKLDFDLKVYCLRVTMAGSAEANPILRKKLVKRRLYICITIPICRYLRWVQQRKTTIQTEYPFVSFRCAQGYKFNLLSDCLRNAADKRLPGVVMVPATYKKYILNLP